MSKIISITSMTKGYYVSGGIQDEEGNESKKEMVLEPIIAVGLYEDGRTALLILTADGYAEWDDEKTGCYGIFDKDGKPVCITVPYSDLQYTEMEE